MRSSNRGMGIYFLIVAAVLLLITFMSNGIETRDAYNYKAFLKDMENVTDYVIIIDAGKIVEEGFVTDLKEKYILVKGEKEYQSVAEKHLITCQSSNYGFEGVALSENLDKFAGMDVEFVTPGLFNISVAVMKQNSKLTMPKL